MDFLGELKKIYKDVVEAPTTETSRQIRIRNAQQVKDLFNSLDIEIKGSEHLPYERNSIFIYNHLHNHQNFYVAENFQITLDSHFISSVLYSYYGDPGIRVTRHALPEEIYHKKYYDRLNYIRVYSDNFIPQGVDKFRIKEANKSFYQQAKGVLEDGRALICSPEGNSFSTQDSPGPFKKGVFSLASSLKPQPKIVPLVLVNFDGLPQKTTYKLQVMPPFKMSDYGITSSKDPKIIEVAEALNSSYRTWVDDLSIDDKDFRVEIELLEQKSQAKQNQKDLIVFYGSSTIRLWSTIERDFPKHNVLNLGFGGAFIHSMVSHFEILFTGLTPKAIFLYLGGNDLNLDLSTEEIIAQSKALIEAVHQRFPQAKICHISIKPSLERQEHLHSIRAINQAMHNLTKEYAYLTQIRLHEALLDQNQNIRKDVLLQDGLHLNAEGYFILKGLVQQALDND